MPKMEDHSIDVLVACGHFVNVRFPVGTSVETRRLEIVTIKELTCSHCSLRQDCADDVEMERRAERIARNGSPEA